ncbi:type III polyketide synthase [Sphingosinicella rhizophila]|uniref:Type III polyketide synthase n=1 Tax=Sphingosinicella rhizophila TaxID=3050082 RepID=A0ABU3Q8H4_9SPHN|nr:type III polyketide synthase [Sphingosinicella sp. GR2756]MDT9599709.1 type III polyketide synthase [Sphingosinicella sp. GR2756]
MNIIAAHIEAIATAVPDHDVHHAFIDWAEGRIGDPRERSLFRRMADRSGIRHRWSILPAASEGGSPIAPGGFYHGALPSTGARMALYAEAAPKLALQAIAGLDAAAVRHVTHLVVASCTGFVAPGIDQIIARQLGLSSQVERTLVGFMGCYAAVSALRLAHHIVRSEPEARVLVVTIELSTLHLQNEDRIEPLLAMLQFGDGAAAALVTAEPYGFAISRPFATTLEDSAGLIRWTIGDQGFAMQLSGEVPGRIAEALRDADLRQSIMGPAAPDEIDCWAVHAGGRSVLDAVQSGLTLAPHALGQSRDVLARYGNMSSSTLLFVLAQLLAAPECRQGVALAFGPGLAAEGFHFRRAG